MVFPNPKKIKLSKLEPSDENWDCSEDTKVKINL